MLDRVEVKELHYNWKTFVEVYLEDYHVGPFHPGLGQFVTCDDLRWQFSDRYSVQTVGVNAGLAKPGTKAYERWHKAVLEYYRGKAPTHGAIWVTLYPNIMLGSINTAPGTAEALVHLVGSLPDGTIWAAAGLGGMQLPVNAIALFMGGHVRVGLEDNPYYDYASRSPATNPLLVNRIGALAATAGRRLATPAEVRDWLGLAPALARSYRLRPAVLPDDRKPILRVLESSNMHHIPSPEMHDLDAGWWYVAGE